MQEFWLGLGEIMRFVPPVAYADADALGNDRPSLRDSHGGELVHHFRAGGIIDLDNQQPIHRRRKHQGVLGDFKGEMFVEF